MPDNLRLSVSKCKTFNQCKKQFEFNYLLKLPKKDREYHVFGHFCHHALEFFHRFYIEGYDQPYNLTMSQAFKSAWEKYGAKMTPEMKTYCKSILTRYLELWTVSKKMGVAPNILAVEKKFEVDLANDIMLNGFIDRIQIDTDGILHVADYKSSKSKKYLKDDFFQLLTYAYVLLRNDPTLQKIRASYIMLKFDCEYITEEFDVKQIMAVEEQFAKYAVQIRAEQEYAPNPTILCGYCDFLANCEAGQKQTRQFSGEVEW